ncbi:hypothetical protein WA158_004631 [Blastocystis sp. Blastoise]
MNDAKKSSKVTNRKCFFHEGSFFYFYRKSPKSWVSISVGPNWIMVSCMIIFLLYVGYMSTKFLPLLLTTPLQALAWILYFIAVNSYLYTATCNPGRIAPSEDNSIENGEYLSHLGYVWCKYCQIYRHPNAVHCYECNCCYQKMDHHCNFMGQCVAKRNIISFYLFLVTSICYIVVIEVGILKRLRSVRNPLEIVYFLLGGWSKILNKPK